MKVFNVGFIGFGYWGRILCRYFQYHPGFNVVHISCRHPETIDVEFDRQVLVSTPENLLDNQDVEVIVVTTPTGLHYSFIKEALERGKHVFTEKPMAVKSEEARNIAELSKTSGLKVFTDYVYTFSPSVKQIVRLAKDGAIGEIQGYSFNISQLGHFTADVYSELGCHVLSVIDMMIPVDYLKFRRNDILVRDGIVETGQLSFEPADSRLKGGNGTIFLSFNYPIKERNITIYGEKGTLIFDIARKHPVTMIRYRVDRLTSKNALDQNIVNYDFDEKNNLSHVVQGFYDVLTDKTESNLESSMRITETLERITGEYECGKSRYSIH
jgi:predicted dehydrogenase